MRGGFVSLMAGLTLALAVAGCQSSKSTRTPYPDDPLLMSKPPVDKTPTLGTPTKSQSSF